MKLTNDEITDIVLNECNKLDKIINNVLLSKFSEIHNVPVDKCVLQLKQEVVASTACFFDKKKQYGLYIINKKGKKVLECDIKGMVMRKSAFPEFTKDNIQLLLDMILKVDEIDMIKINEFINSRILEIINLCEEGSKKIAGVVSFNTPTEQSKIIPSHVKAMTLWNDLEYEYFVPGTKGYLFRIEGIDSFLAPTRIIDRINKLSSKNISIAVPYEEDRLPEYYIINQKDQLEYVWTKRVAELMSAFRLDNIATMFEDSFDVFE